MSEKNEIRRLIRERREDLQGAWIEEVSIQAQQHLIGLKEFSSAKVVATYISVEGEVLTDMIIRHCHEAGIKLCVPAFSRITQSYRMSVMDKEAEILMGPLNIPEPSVRNGVSLRDIDLVIVPGLAFDESGGRVGHGGGHYDRMLGGMKSAFKVGLAFNFQVLNSVPMADHDVRLDGIVTEKGPNLCSGEEQGLLFEL